MDALRYRPPDVEERGVLPLPRRAPGDPGGLVPSDDELLERTLAFAGSPVPRALLQAAMVAAVGGAVILFKALLH